MRMRELRHAIANWISGGELDRESRSADRMQRDNLNYIDEISRMRVALERIIALETPNMAHVGKKAVALAKKGLGE